METETSKMRTDQELKDMSDKARRALRRFLVKHTDGCTVQDGWPCGTCAMDLFTRMGLDSTAPAYSEHNPGHERHNEVWRAILQIRDSDGVDRYH